MAEELDEVDAGALGELAEGLGSDEDFEEAVAVDADREGEDVGEERGAGLLEVVAEREGWVEPAAGGGAAEVEVGNFARQYSKLLRGSGLAR